MDAREDPHVVVHDRLALRVGRVVEVVLTGDAVRHEGARLVAPAVDVGNGDPVLFQELLEAHLVFQREQRGGSGSVAAHHELQCLATALDVDEPHRPPARLPADGEHLAADVRVHPLRDALLVVHHRPPNCTRARTAPAVIYRNDGRRPSWFWRSSIR